MLLAVVLVIILALIHREYVPAWVKENEADHMNQADNELSLFKATVDNQILMGNTNLTLYSSFTLGNEGVPFFAPPTSGSLTLNSFANSMVLTSADSSVNLTGTGNLFFDSANHEFKDQQRGYEFGALLLNQTSGDSIMTTAPSFSVSNSSGVVNITLTMATLLGGQRSVGGIDTEGLLTTLKLYQQDSFSWAGGNGLTIVITTQFPAAWQSYFTTTLGNELGSSAYSVTRSASTVTVTLTAVHKLDLALASLDVSFNNL